MKRWWLIPLVPGALIGSVVVLFVGVFIVGPRLVLHRFDAFTSRHPVGSAVKDVGDDAFVESATMAMFDGKLLEHEPAGVHRATVKKILDEHDSGTLDIMWTHTPPFGRISAIFTFEAGRIVKVDTPSLD